MKKCIEGIKAKLRRRYGNIQGQSEIALILTHRMQPVRRIFVGILGLIIGFGYWTLVRGDGIWGDFHASRSWRWQPTAEDLFLANIETRSSVTPSSVSAELSLGTPEWPGFRGPNRNGTLPGVKLLTVPVRSGCHIDTEKQPVIANAARWERAAI